MVAVRMHFKVRFSSLSCVAEPMPKFCHRGVSAPITIRRDDLRFQPTLPICLLVLRKPFRQPHSGSPPVRLSVSGPWSSTPTHLRVATK
ncbi:hypothetical protein LshimejAT787_0100720 [Lyophyllum shimeji]|uniref:Uncharacterized protein n=1 Tax=Lyophyllum shimeji TaxID=47721 RepID=A0A9P3PCF7_LYOSH|nr:hypothetical protein LshimejAT787_0100720 [Lyophyllum shimeji]